MIATQTNISKTKTRVLTLFSILAGGALFIVLFLHFRHDPIQKSIPLQGYEGVLSSGDLSIPITIADTPEEQEQGLSGTDSLTEGTGKLFVFKTPAIYGFWMKDMQYPLDIIWIGTDMRIVSISEYVTPESYPTVFYPPQAVGYVLEVNAGFSTTHHLVKNQLLTLTNNLSF